MTKHSPDCQRVFGNYDPECQRCRELMVGFKPRKGWQHDYYARKAREEEIFKAGLRQHHHDSKTNRCSCGAVVCTFGDW